MPVNRPEFLEYLIAILQHVDRIPARIAAPVDIVGDGSCHTLLDLYSIKFRGLSATQCATQIDDVDDSARPPLQSGAFA